MFSQNLVSYEFVALSLPMVVRWYRRTTISSNMKWNASTKTFHAKCVNWHYQNDHLLLNILYAYASRKWSGKIQLLSSSNSSSCWACLNKWKRKIVIYEQWLRIWRPASPLWISHAWRGLLLPRISLPFFSSFHVFWTSLISNSDKDSDTKMLSFLFQHWRDSYPSSLLSPRSFFSLMIACYSHKFGVISKLSTEHAEDFFHGIFACTLTISPEWNQHIPDLSFILKSFTSLLHVNENTLWIMNRSWCGRFPLISFESLQKNLKHY